MAVQTNFTLIINLSNFFKDHRQIARIFIGDKVTTIQDIQNKIKKVFGVENFYLLSKNEYLPPSEDIRILRRDDIIWAIPATLSNLSYENIEAENIEYSKLKKTKRKSNSAVNETDQDVSKKRRKRRIYSADSQEGHVRENPSKYEAEIKVTTEETEDHTVRTKKKKKKHIYEELQLEDECISKIPKKNKHKNVEETESTCTYKIQKQIENSKKKNMSESNKYNYVEKSINDYQVTVGNSLSENVTFKKCTPVPTITDEYLKGKKINIVKIDYLSKPSTANQIEAPSIDNIELDPIQHENKISKCETDMLKNSSDIKETKSSSINKTKSYSIDESKSSFIKTDGGVEKTTRFFFLNTPSKPQITKPVNKPKRSNMFKLNLSPMVINKIETNRKEKIAEEKRFDMYQLGLNPTVMSNENIGTSCEKQEKKTAKEATNKFMVDVTKNKEMCVETPCVDVLQNYRKKTDNSNENVMVTETKQMTENETTAKEAVYKFKNDMKPSVTENKEICAKTSFDVFQNYSKKAENFNPNVMITENETTAQEAANKFKHDMKPCVTESREMFVETPSVDVCQNYKKKTDNFCANVMITEKINFPSPTAFPNGHSNEVSPAIYIADDTHISSTPTPENVKRASVPIYDRYSKLRRHGQISSCVTTPENVETSRASATIDSSLETQLIDKCCNLHGSISQISPYVTTPVNVDTVRASGIVDSSMETQGNRSILDKYSNLQRISQISSCVTTMLDTPVDDFGISGIEVINHSKYSARKQISGVGQLLGSIRKSESFSEAFNETPNSSEFVTKRKRTRRTRSKKKKSTSTIAEETISPINTSIRNSQRPMLTASNPKLHIKFSDNIENGNDNQDYSIISIGSENGDLQVIEENILLWPLMSGKEPKIGNIISFKILKMSDDFTPEVSSYIIGRVMNFSAESKLVVLEITCGLEQFEGPSGGKFSLDDQKEGNISSVFKECLWSDLIEPRLIDP